MKLRLEDQFKQEWGTQVATSASCYNYNIFKTEFGIEQYLLIDLPPQHRNILCKFRTTNHKLAVELGRYTNVLRSRRFCNICDEEILGDEYHFVLECSALNDLRIVYT
jgi:hypothetical protein